MISATMALLQEASRRSLGCGTKLLARKTPKQYMEQKYRKIKRRNKDQLHRLKKQRVVDKSAPYATFAIDSKVVLSDDDQESSSAKAISIGDESDMKDASLPVQNVDLNRIEVLHKAAIIGDRRHRNSFLQSFSEMDCSKNRNIQRQRTKEAVFERDYPNSSSILSSSSSPSTPPLSSSAASSSSSSSSTSSSAASKLRKRITDDVPRANRRSKSSQRGGQLIKGGKSSLKEGFRAPEFKRLPDMENKMRYHSSFPLRNTG